MILDCWFYTQESDAVAAAPALATAGQDQVSSAVTRLLEQRLAQPSLRKSSLK